MRGEKRRAWIKAPNLGSSHLPCQPWFFSPFLNQVFISWLPQVGNLLKVIIDLDNWSSSFPKKKIFPINQHSIYLSIYPFSDRLSSSLLSFNPIWSWLSLHKIHGRFGFSWMLTVTIRALVDVPLPSPPFSPCLVSYCLRWQPWTFYNSRAFFFF